MNKLFNLSSFFLIIVSNFLFSSAFAQEIPLHEVKDVINIPALSADFSEHIVSYCQKNGVNDPEIIVIAKINCLFF